MHHPVSKASAESSIKPINRQSIHRICSGQVILDLGTAIKELIENALDAGASNIEVRLREYGSALVEVADNGQGVPPADYQALTLKYHTSKITSFDDLTSVNTYGFRGEALSSLCSVSELSIVTRTAEQAAGVRLEYDHEGLLTSQTPAPRAVGTTVAIKNLFATMPVRHKEFLRNVKREFTRAVSVIQAYALIATHARLIVTNQAGKSGARTTVITTAAPAATYDAYVAAAAAADASPQGDKSTGRALPGCLGVMLSSATAAAAEPRVRAELAALRDNIVAVFGGRVAESLEPLSLPEDTETGVQVVGWVSRAGCGLRGDASRQFFFLNGRPVDLPKASRVLNDAFKSLSSPAHAACRPMAVLAVRLASSDVDINVTPDKRRVFMAAEDRLVSLLQQALHSLWEPSRCTFTVNQPLLGGPAGSADGSGNGSVLIAVGPQRNAGRQCSQQRQLQLSVGQILGIPAAAHGDDDYLATCRDGMLADADATTTTTTTTTAEDTELDAKATEHLRAAKRARFVCSVKPGSGTAAESSSPRAPLHTYQLDSAVEPSPGLRTAAASTVEANKQQRSLPGRGRCTVPASAAAPAFRHPFLSLFSGNATAASDLDKDLETAVPAAAADVRDDRTLEAGITAGDSWNHVSRNHRWHHRPTNVRSKLTDDAADEKPGCHEEEGSTRRSGKVKKVVFRLEDEREAIAAVGAGATGAAQTIDATDSHGRVEEAKDVEMGEAWEAQAEGQQWQERSPQIDASSMQATGSFEDVLLDPASTVNRTGPDSSGAATDAGKPGGIGRAPAEVLAGESGEDLRPKLNRIDGERTVATAVGTEEQLTSRVAASPVAVLRLEPGQLAGLMATRIRHLRAQMQRRREQQEATAACGGAGANGMCRGAATAVTGRKFTSASLAEDPSGNTGGFVPEDGGVGTRDGAGSGGNTLAEREKEREAAAERELERVFRKSQFREMRVIGQFNLGFILARHGSDVFIVDQHAAAEKTTFERLQRTVVLTRQPLLVPMPLPTGVLLPVDQLLIREHIDVFRRNGFDFVERRLDGKLVPLNGAAARRGTSAAWQQIQIPNAPPAQLHQTHQAPCNAQNQQKVKIEPSESPEASETKLGPIRSILSGGGIEAGTAADVGWHGMGGSGGGGYESYDGMDSELLLSSVPVSRATGQLGMEDVVELVGLLRARESPAVAAAAPAAPAGGAVAGNEGVAPGRAWEEELRPFRVRAMLASRACRSSIMVGKPLNRAEMRRLLDGLADLRQPWNCPHGRPTMRHVCVLPEQPGLLPT